MKGKTGLAAFNRKLTAVREQPPPPAPRPRGRSRPTALATAEAAASAPPKPRGTSGARPAREQAAAVRAAQTGRRGAREIVALTVRVARADWARLSQLAVEEGTSIQQLALRGFTEIFREKGLPPVQIVASTLVRKG